MSASQRAIAFMTECIDEGGWTRAELVEATIEEVPDLAPSTIATLISDGKNPKYNRFNALLTEDEGGIISFE